MLHLMGGIDFIDTEVSDYIDRPVMVGVLNDGAEAFEDIYGRNYTHLPGLPRHKFPDGTRELDVNFIVERFNSDFSAESGTAITASGWWQQGAADSGTAALIQESRGEMSAEQGAGFVTRSVRPAVAFDPMMDEGVRFESTLVGAMHSSDDPGSEFVFHSLFLTNTDEWSEAGRAEAAPKIQFEVNAQNEGDEHILTLRVINGAEEQGIDLASFSFLPSILDLYGGGQQLGLVLELGDGAAGDDLRGGYRILDVATDTWSEWAYTEWFDLSDDLLGDHAFSFDWADDWNGNTHLYVETYINASGTRSGAAVFDDVLITLIPEPGTAMCLMGGLILLVRRQHVRHAGTFS